MNRKRRWLSLLLSGVLLCQGCSGALAATEKQGVDVSVTKQAETARLPLGGISRWEQQGSRVVFTAAGGRLAVTFLQPDAVRVRLAAPGQDFANDESSQAIAKRESDYDPVSLTLTEEDGCVSLRSSALTVTVDTATGALGYYTADGALITRNTAEGISRDAAGEGKTVAFERDAAGVEEHFFGLGSSGEGNDFKTLDWRDKTYELWLKDTNIHAITPLVYSTAGYGIFLNNAYHGQMVFKADPYEIHVDGGEMDYVFFYGPTLKTVLAGFTDLSGHMAMPPLYALGLTLRGDSKWDGDRLLATLRAFYDAGISIDTLGVEPGWQTATYPCTYVWSDKFPDPAGFVNTVHGLGARVNLWEHPYVRPSSPIYADLLPYGVMGTDIYPRAEFGNGTTRYGFGGLIPDFTRPEAREIFWSLQKQNLASIGVDGFKIDETDSWSGPNDPAVIWPTGMTSNLYHNLLGTLTTNLLHEKYKTDYNRRTYIFSRGNYTGMQRYATTAYTDYYGFDQFLRAVLVQSYAGTYFTPEIRTVSTSNNVDYMRRMQMMLLTPFAMFNEWADGNTVLGRSSAVRENAREYVNLHYALIPYMYSLFWQQHLTGVPVVRPLMMEFDDPAAVGVDSQYMLGGDLMAAPVNSTSMVAKRRVVLPAGSRWMDYHTGYVYEGGQTISYISPCSVLPLFVRMGAILPLGRYGNNTQSVDDPTLSFDLYPDETVTSFTLYEDDGISYDYEQGAYCTTTLTLSRQPGLLTVAVGERQTPADARKRYLPPTRDLVLLLHYRGKPAAVRREGAALTEVTADAFGSAPVGVWCWREEEQVVAVKLRDTGRAQTVTAAVPEEAPQPDEPPVAGLTGFDTYECESADNTLADGASVRDLSNASGGKVVTGIGARTGGSLTMRVTAAEAGPHTLRIGYVTTSASCLLTVGEADPVEIVFPSTGGASTVGEVDVVLPLQAGVNVLTFSQPNGTGPQLDFVAVSRALAETEVAPRGKRYEAEDHTALSVVQAHDNPVASGGQTVIGFGTKAKSLIVALDEAAQDGPYQISVTFANPDAGSLSLYYSINGVVQQNPLLLETTHSPQLMRTVTFTAYLGKGYNDLAFFLDQTADSRLEIDCVTVADQTADEALAQEASDVTALVDEIGSVTAQNAAEKAAAVEQAETAVDRMRDRYGRTTADEVLGQTLTRLRRARELVDFYTSGRVYGDVDGSPGVNASDALAVLQHSVKLRELTGLQLELADVNLDDQVNAADALLILQFSVALVPLLPRA